MSNAEFSISCEDFETILLFVDLMVKNKYRPNIQEAHRLLTKIEDEMEKYENKGCDVVIELCEKMRKTSYSNKIIIMFELSNLIQAVNAISTDATRKVIIDEFIDY